MAKVILVGCGAKKLACAAPARDLYIGSLFTDARCYAESSGLPWGVISALHGFLLPDQVVEPYDYRLRPATGEWDQWAEWIRHKSRLAYGSYAHAILLMGADYADRIAVHLDRDGITTEQPLRGLGLGYRRRWLRQPNNLSELVSDAS